MNQENSSWNIGDFRDPVIEQAARPLYDAGLPYHNFNHALEATANGGKLVNRCNDEGIRIDARVVYYALLFHDAGYHEDPLSHGFSSREAYAAHLAEVALREHAVPNTVIELVVAAIESTHADADFATAEQKAVRAADLMGMAADYSVFRRNAERLKTEHEMLSGATVSWSDWVARVSNVIEIYLQQEIRLTTDFYNLTGESWFHSRVRRNLEKLRGD